MCDIPSVFDAQHSGIVSRRWLQHKTFCRTASWTVSRTVSRPAHCPACCVGQICKLGGVFCRTLMSHASASNGLSYMKDANQNAQCNRPLSVGETSQPKPTSASPSHSSQAKTDFLYSKPSGRGKIDFLPSKPIRSGQNLLPHSKPFQSGQNQFPPFQAIPVRPKLTSSILGRSRQAKTNFLHSKPF
jgi:hypothetical protein